MKTNKVIAGIAAFALAAPMFTSSVFAAWPAEAGGTTVSYDNSSNIPDPDNPSNPQWAVKVPSSVTFTDTSKKVDASVSIENINGGAYPAYLIHVGVKSAHGYKLEYDADSLDYDLQYEKDGVMTSVKASTNTVKEIGSFQANLTNIQTIKGNAILSSTQAATKTGSHTDTLTYSISKTAF